MMNPVPILFRAVSGRRGLRLVKSAIVTLHLSMGGVSRRHAAPLKLRSIAHHRSFPPLLVTPVMAIHNLRADKK
ncbi:MAG: hypothetical protein OJF51_003195 [Nitrospira sp.]|jgi:hypothetical protein|nr:MAG: hypothetical protein OJF51_003195 [Nitrospira sp.]